MQSRVHLGVSEVRDSIYFAQLAKAARRLAANHPDPVVSRHLRETAVKHDRTARELARVEQASKVRKRSFSDWLSRRKK